MLPKEWKEVHLTECLVGSSLRNTDGRLSSGDLRSVNKAKGMIPMKDSVKGNSVDRAKVVMRDWFAYNPMRLNIGSICRWDGEEDCIVSPDYVVFRCNEDLLLTDYFDQYRQSYAWMSYMENAGHGGVRVRIYLKDLYPLRIKLPPLDEQRKIASILGVWDKAIDLFENKLKKSVQSKKGLCQQLLSGKRRLKGFNAEWKEHRMGELFFERNEKGYAHLELLSISQKDGIVPQNKSDKKDSSNSNKDKYLRICPGDIGYNTMRMWQGASALSSVEGIVSPAYTVITPKEGVHGKYVSYLFKYPPIVHLFRRYSQGLTSDTWNLKFPVFSKIALRLPPVKEQAAISNLLESSDKEILFLERKLKLLKEQKLGLMQKLLSGLNQVS